MKSICIKTNNEKSIQYLLNELQYFNLNNVCFSLRDFKHYKNVIIHYTGLDNDLFLRKISSLLSFLVIDELEESILNNIIFKNYFYFDLPERKQILNFCFDINADDLTSIFENKFNALSKAFYEFFLINRSMFLQGFINFRINEYLKILDDIVDEAVNQYVIEKEYNEFISLLKLYINSKNTNCSKVHLIYLKNESFLLDENKQIINTSKDILNTKYLSDISFSSNDFTLNSLLNLLPKEIYIHIIDCNIDEFIITLQSVFENRIKICQNCNICSLYKNSLKTESPNTI